MRAALFAAVLCVAPTLGWLSPNVGRTGCRRLPSGTQRLSAARDSRQQRPTEVDGERTSPTRTSRRQWFADIASTTAAVGASSVLGWTPPADAAASVVSTVSVCDPAVSVWARDGRIVYLLGTAHVSSVSAQLAGNLVRDIHPNAVFVELDAKRVRGSGILAKRVGDAATLSADNDSDNGNDDGSNPTRKSDVIIPNIVQLSQQQQQQQQRLLASNGEPTDTVDAAGIAQAPPPPPPSIVTQPQQRANPFLRAATAAVGNGIRSMYKKLDSAGFNAGEEFAVAMKEAQDTGADIILGDRDVEVTLRRVTEGLAKTDLNALLSPDSELEKSMAELVPSQMANKDVMSDLSDPNARSEFTNFVEVIKTKENVRKIMGQLQQTAPALYEALVTERDAYMAAGLNGLNDYEAIVAVMGIAHVDGVENNLRLNGWKLVNPTCPTV